MRPQGKIICRLCLQICDNFRAVEGYVKDFLDIVLPKIDLTVVLEPMMCTNCVDLLMNCYDFKATCLSSQDYIVPFINNEDTIKLDLIDAYLIKNENVTGVLEDQVICGFCMSQVKKCLAKPLDGEDGDVVLENMIERCLPELDLSVIKKPVICAPCHCSLENCFHFVTNSLIVEDKIKKYCETLDPNNKTQIDLSDLLQFTMGDVTASEVDGNSCNIIKVEKEFYEESENSDERVLGNADDTFKLEQMFCENSENMKEEIEHEIKSFIDVDDLKFDNEDHFTPVNTLACKVDSNNPDVIKMEEMLCGVEELKEENLVEIEDQKFLVNEEINIKSEEQYANRFQDGVATRIFSGWESLMSNLEGNLSESNIKHTLTKKHVSKIRMHQCNCCSYQTKNKYCLRRHLLVHRNPSETTIYECDSCSFQTKFEYDLKQHLVVHKSLKKHLLVHRDPSEVTMHKCDSCSYQTKSKYLLKQHLLVHSNPCEVTMYKCESCSYQTKRRGCLKKHLLVHMDPSEVTMHKCDSCSYQTRYKDNFKEHLLVHKNSSEVTMYKCDSCLFQTKYKSYLKEHLLIHRDPSEVTMYKCDSCSFQTKHKKYLKTHLLVHRNPSKLTMYKCDSCSYQADCKARLKNHFLKHKDLSEVPVFNCNSCSFRTKYEYSLKKHLLVHKDPSELTMYKCDSCSFETKDKVCLKRHLLVHKNPSEVTIYKCDSCSYQAKHKHYLKQHISRIHKNI